jgi:hypothetical protein
MEIQMSIGFPTNTVILILVAMIGVAAGSWFSLSQALKQLSTPQYIRRTLLWSIAILLIAWLLFRLALAVEPPGGGVLATPFIVTFLVVGILAGTLPLMLSSDFRQIIHAVPATWLVGIHAIRVFGFLFLALMDMKLLPAQFALPAGYGDIMVGLLALVIIYLLAKGHPYARTLAIGWNMLGLLDFAVALMTGIIYTGPFAAQLATTGASLSYLNYVLIVPTFGVPLFTLLHIYSLFQMLSSPAEKTEQELKVPALT